MLKRRTLIYSLALFSLLLCTAVQANAVTILSWHSTSSTPGYDLKLSLTLDAANDGITLPYHIYTDSDWEGLFYYDTFHGQELSAYSMSLIGTGISIEQTTTGFNHFNNDFDLRGFLIINSNMTFDTSFNLYNCSAEDSRPFQVGANAWHYNFDWRESNESANLISGTGYWELTTSSPVPEPSTLVLLSAGLAGALFFRWRSKNW